MDAHFRIGSMTDTGAEQGGPSSLADVLGALLPGTTTFGAGDGDVSQIVAHDPGFDATHFLSHVDEVRQAILAAFKDHNAKPLRRFVSPGLYPALDAQATGSGPASVDDNPTVSNSAIHSAHSDPTFDTVVVRLTTAPASSSGSAHTTDWTFQRSSKATTTATATQRCPQCGAPLSFDDSGQCSYCHAALNVSDLDWVLVRIQEAANPFASRIHVTSASNIDFSELTTESRRATKLGVWIAVIFGGGGILAAIVIPIVLAVTGHSTTHRTFNPFSNNPTPTVAPLSGPSTLTAKLTLTGAINLSPSQINSDEFIVNGLPPGTCPASSDTVRTLVLNVTFDSGAKLTGTFTPAHPVATGATVDLATGGVATIHFSGPTQATADDQLWNIPAGQAGAATIARTTNAGTLKWQGFTATEQDHNDTSPISGLLTWTCG